MGDLGSADEFESADEFNKALQDTINKYLKDIGVEDINQVDNPEFTVDVNNLEFTDKHNLGKVSIRPSNGGTMTYKSGELKLNLNPNDKPITIKCDDNAADNLKLTLNNDVSRSSNKQTTVTITTTNKNSVHITSSSELASDLKIKVSDNVKDLTIDSVKLTNEGGLSAVKENGNPVQVKVKNLEVKARTDTSLSKVTISNEFKLTQTAQVNLKDGVTFGPGSKLSLDLHNLGINGFITPLLKGKLNTPPQEININLQDNSGKPQVNTDYLLFDGQFEGGCDAWKEKVTVPNGFNDKVCNEVSSRLQAAAKHESLALRNNKSKDNKLTTAQIAGIVVGCVAAVAIVVIVVVVVVIKKKKNRDSSTGENEEKGKGKEKDDDEDL